MLEICAVVMAGQPVDGQVEFKARKMSLNKALPRSSPERTVLFAIVTVLFVVAMTQAVSGCSIVVLAS